MLLFMYIRIYTYSINSYLFIHLVVSFKYIYIYRYTYHPAIADKSERGGWVGWALGCGVDGANGQDPILATLTFRKSEF